MALALGKGEAALKKAKRIAAKVTRHSRDLMLGSGKPKPRPKKRKHSSAKVTRYSRDL